MGLLSRRFAFVLGIGLSTILAACQGGGGSSGLTLPQAGNYNNPGGPGSATQSVSRQQVLEGTVVVGPELADLPLPTVDGFAISIALGSPEPKASGSAEPTASPTGSSTPTPSPAPSSHASGSPSAHPSPGPAAASGPKAIVKTTIYPDDAPVAPTPAPTGDVVTFVKRVALVRGFVQPAADLTLSGLGALRFTIPSIEQTAGRGFTIAAFQAAKKHHEVDLASDTGATLSNDAVTSSAPSPAIVLKKGTGYLLVLYGDELPATPAPAPSGYPSPGNNPFPTPTATSFPGVPGNGPYGTPTPAGMPAPYGSPH